MNQESNVAGAMARVAAVAGEEEQRLSDTYYRYIGKLAAGAELTSAEAKEFAGVMQRVALDSYKPNTRGAAWTDVTRHVEALRDYRRCQAQANELKASSSLPPARDLRRQIDEIDADIAPKIAALLDPKRVIERQLVERLELDRQIDAAQQAASRAKPDFAHKIPE